MTEVFKVVRVLDDGSCVSAIIVGVYRVRYEIGTESTGIAGSPLMAFVDFQLAENFLRCQQSATIMRCNATGAKKAKWVSGTSGSCDIEAFWHRSNPEKGRCISRRPPPKGTLLCDSITPLEVV